jgi:hypothetical protein
MQGAPSELRYVEHLGFRGITFAFTNWDLPPGDVNNRQAAATVPGAITLTGARQVTFDRCTLKGLGTFAFEVGAGSSELRFTYNELRHLGAGAFRINGGDETSHPLLRTGRNYIADNHIHDYGEVFRSAAGILLMHTHANTVEHNHLHHGYYTAISVGWRWGYQRSVSRDNVVAFNDIHHVGQGLLSDMGGIYTLGVQPGTVIRGNLIYEVQKHNYGGWGIYLDEGSSHILVEGNVC